MARPTYYPSCVVNLTIRFDEAYIGGAPDPQVISTKEAADSPARIPSVPAPKPAMIQGARAPRGDNDGTGFVTNIVPTKCVVEKSSVHSAATFDMTIAFNDLPLDPRTIRALGVEIHMGTVSSEDFARGMRRERRADGSLYSTLATRDPSTGRVNNRTLVLVGIADNIEEDIAEGKLYVQIKGRDQRGILINSPLPPGLINNLDYNDDIVGIVQQILDKHPLSERMRVTANPAEWEGGVLPGALPTTILPAQRQQRARQGRGRQAHHPPGHGNTPRAAPEMSYWDLITRMCALCGAVPMFQNAELLIRPQRSLFRQLRGDMGTQRTPFNPDEPRRVFGDAPITVRRMVLGQTLASLKFSRKLVGPARPKTVRCVSFDMSAGSREGNRIIEARFPPEQPPVPTPPAGGRGSHRNPRAHTAAPAGNRAQEDILTFPIEGIRSVERLRQIAEGIFEQLGRNEITGSFESRNLASFGAEDDNADPDMLRAEPGDAVEVVQQARAVRDGQQSALGTVADHYTASYEERVQELTERLGNAAFARAILASARGRTTPLQRVFRLSSIRLMWGDKKVEVTGDLQNYIMVRNDDQRTERAAVQPITRSTHRR